MLKEVVGVAGQHLNVFAGDLVGHPHHLGVVGGQDDLPVVTPRLGGHFGGRQYGQLPFDFAHHFTGQFLGGGQQHRWAVQAVFRLSQQVGGDHLCVDRIVGDHQGFRRPGEQINAHLSEQLALGLGHVGVARPDEHVHRCYRAGTQGQGSQRLYAAHDVDLVGSGQVHGRHCGRVGQPVLGGRDGHHPFHPRDLGRRDAHQGAGDHRVPSAGYVTGHRVHRQHLVPQGHARNGFDLDLVN